jgi:hypothetical protein
MGTAEVAKGMGPCIGPYTFMRFREHKFDLLRLNICQRGINESNQVHECHPDIIPMSKGRNEGARVFMGEKIGATINPLSQKCVE